jgi:hypothetical protein
MGGVDTALSAISKYDLLLKRAVLCLPSCLQTLHCWIITIVKLVRPMGQDNKDNTLVVAISLHYWPTANAAEQARPRHNTRVARLGMWGRPKSDVEIYVGFCPQVRNARQKTRLGVGLLLLPVVSCKRSVPFYRHQPAVITKTCIKQSVPPHSCSSHTVRKAVLHCPSIPSISTQNAPLPLPSQLRPLRANQAPSLLSQL